MKYAITRVLVDDMILMGEQLTQQHYKEVPFGSDKLEFDIDWDAFHIIENEGCLLVLAAFDIKSNLVGYLVVITTPMLHHAGKYIAVTDSFYVHPKHRKHGVFEALLNRAVEMCREAEVTAFRVGVNQNFPLDPDMLTRLGLSHAETIYQQEL